MNTLIRDYRDEDYPACKDLVDVTWGFSVHFKPVGFCNLAKHMYTYGSLVSSNFRKVIESDGQVVGFIFGRNERKPLKAGPARVFALNLNFLLRLLLLRNLRLKEKFAFLGVLSQHEINRSQIEKHGASEVVLFAIDKQFQGHGIGRGLLLQFLNDCQEQGVGRVIVEVNVAQASGFYQKCGFTKIQDFVSPLHEIAAGKGTIAAMYEIDLESTS